MFQYWNIILSWVKDGNTTFYFLRLFIKGPHAIIVRLLKFVGTILKPGQSITGTGALTLENEAM